MFGKDNKDRHLAHWEEGDFQELNNTGSYSQMWTIAERVLKRMPPPVSQVCGPLSTGGLGSFEANVKRFEETILRLCREGLTVFNQMPFQAAMLKILENRNSDDYDHSLLNDFYLPLFESGMVQTLHFIPDWQTSIGATWEHEQAKRLGLKIIYL